MRTPANQLISSILVADGDGPALRQAASYFLRQTYPDKELIILLAGEAGDLTDLPDDPQIKVSHASRDVSWGERLASALGNCRGRYVCWWDASDWIGPERLSAQVNALAHHGTTMCIADAVIAFNPHEARAWRCRETRPGLLARKTWCCDRELSAGLPGGLSSALANLAERPSRAFAGATVATTDASWYLWVLKGTSTPSLPTRCLKIESVPPGDAIRTVSPDREYFISLRNRYRTHKPRRPGPIRNRATPSASPAIVEVPDRSGRGAPKPRGRVSCLMPTFNRPSFLLQAIRCFLAQDYPDREMVIVDDSPESAEEQVPQHAGIIYIRLRERRSIGAKRNLAVEAASGDYLVCWDDDDWSGPRRISHQVAPLLAGGREVTALLTGYVLDLQQRQFWHKPSDRAGMLFQHGVNWGTLSWTRAAQKAGIRFPDSSLAEDVAFKDALVRHGARVQCLENPGLYIYVRHGANTWRFAESRMLSNDQWEQIEPPDFIPPGALEFYGFPSLHACAPLRDVTHSV